MNDAMAIQSRSRQPMGVITPLLDVFNESPYADDYLRQGIIDLTLAPDDKPKLIAYMEGMPLIGVVTLDGIEWLKTDSVSTCIGLLTMRYETSKILKAGIYDPV